MARDSFKECRCGRRIPDDWACCPACKRVAKLDGLEYGREARMERAQMVRVALATNRLVKPAVDPEIQEALLDGLSKRASEHRFLEFRKRMHAMQHIQVLRTNIAARNLDLRDQDLGT